MLQVKIDLVPFGDESGRKTIHSMFIWNVGVVDGDLCEYFASEVDPRGDYRMALGKAVLVQHHRSNGAWKLVEIVRKQMNRRVSRESVNEPNSEGQEISGL